MRVELAQGKFFLQWTDKALSGYGSEESNLGHDFQIMAELDTLISNTTHRLFIV